MDMLSISSQLVPILLLIAALFSYAVLRPLNNAISELRATIQELRSDLRHNEEQRHKIEVKLAEVDQRAKAAHHRLDDLVEICEKTHGFKIPHPGDSGTGGGK